MDPLDLREELWCGRGSNSLDHRLLCPHCERLRDVAVAAARARAAAAAAREAARAAQVAALQREARARIGRWVAYRLRGVRLPMMPLSVRREYMRRFHRRFLRAGEAGERRRALALLFESGVVANARRRDAQRRGDEERRRFGFG